MEKSATRVKFQPQNVQIAFVDSSLRRYAPSGKLLKRLGKYGKSWGVHMGKSESFCRRRLTIHWIPPEHPSSTNHPPAELAAGSATRRPSSESPTLKLKLPAPSRRRLPPPWWPEFFRRCFPLRNDLLRIHPPPPHRHQLAHQLPPHLLRHRRVIRGGAATARIFPGRSQAKAFRSVVPPTCSCFPSALLTNRNGPKCQMISSGPEFGGVRPYRKGYSGLDAFGFRRAGLFTSLGNAADSCFHDKPSRPAGTAT